MPPDPMARGLMRMPAQVEWMPAGSLPIEMGATVEPALPCVVWAKPGLTANPVARRGSWTWSVSVIYHGGRVVDDREVPLAAEIQAGVVVVLDVDRLVLGDRYADDIPLVPLSDRGRRTTVVEGAVGIDKGVACHPRVAGNAELEAERGLRIRRAVGSR